jgi:hypothetical protein
VLNSKAIFAIKIHADNMAVRKTMCPKYMCIENGKVRSLSLQYSMNGFHLSFTQPFHIKMVIKYFHSHQLQAILIFLSVGIINIYFGFQNFGGLLRLTQLRALDD